jgi:hypothetical protein
MNRRSKYGMLFLKQEGVEGGGAATGAGNSSASNGGEGDIDLKTVFPGVDLDNLDDSSRAALTAQAKQFATLQVEQQKTVEQMRQFQSRADQSAAELQRIKSSITGNQPVTDPAAAQLSEIEQIMVSNGVSAAAAKSQAPIMQKLLDAQRKNILSEVGQGVAPVADMVLKHQAEQAFNVTRSQDRMGAFEIPEVAQAIWNSTMELVRSNTPVTPETVKNLKAMHLMAHAESNPGVFATLQMNPVPGVSQPPGGVPGSRVPLNVTTGGFNYPGAMFSSLAPAPADPNAPKTTLDAGTRTALQSIFSQLKPGHNIK